MTSSWSWGEGSYRLVLSLTLHITDAHLGFASNIFLNRLLVVDVDCVGGGEDGEKSRGTGQRSSP